MIHKETSVQDKRTERNVGYLNVIPINHAADTVVDRSICPTSKLVGREPTKKYQSPEQVVVNNQVYQEAKAVAMITIDL